MNGSAGPLAGPISMSTGVFNGVFVTTTEGVVGNAYQSGGAQQRKFTINFKNTPSGSISYNESNGQPSKPATIAIM